MEKVFTMVRQGAICYLVERTSQDSDQLYLVRTVPHVLSLPPRNVIGTFCYHFEYHLHVIGKSIYNMTAPSQETIQTMSPGVVKLVTCPKGDICVPGPSSEFEKMLYAL